MQVFVRVIEKGSFSAVAKERGIGQPAVSKQISALEDELGTELIRRTSRSIALTEAGRVFYESSVRILDDFESATSRIGRGQTAPKGLIRVAVPPAFARLHMVSKLPAFFTVYPDMAIEMSTSESPATAVEDGFDLAIPLRRSPGLHSGCAKIRADEYRSRRHSSISRTLRCTGIAGRS